MERKDKKIALIITSDWHLRDTIPPCRTDDFIETQWQKVAFISKLQQKHDCPVIHAGDLFDNWKPSPHLLTKTIENIPKNFYTIYGNHDLPQHSLDMADKCGVRTVEAAGALTILSKTHWGDSPDCSLLIRDRKILVWHVLAYQGIPPYPGAPNTAARRLIRQFPDYDLIITGHNHKSFIETYNGRVLLNPGCITRQESDESSYIPKVWLYCAETNTVEAVHIPHSPGVVIKPINTVRKEECRQRIDAFISKLDTDLDISLDFGKNLEQFFLINKVGAGIKDIIYKTIKN